VYSPYLTVCYEKLRAQVLGEETVFTSPVGLGLFLQKGMAAWMMGWSLPETTATLKQVRTPVPQVLSSELAMLLAEAVLNRRDNNEYRESKGFAPSA
jgi:hypothetical protein